MLFLSHHKFKNFQFKSDPYKSCKQFFLHHVNKTNYTLAVVSWIKKSKLHKKNFTFYKNFNRRWWRHRDATLTKLGNNVLWFHWYSRVSFLVDSMKITVLRIRKLVANHPLKWKFDFMDQFKNEINEYWYLTNIIETTVHIFVACDLSNTIF